MTKRQVHEFYTLLNADAAKASQRFWHYFPNLYDLKESDQDHLGDFIAHDPVVNRALLLAVGLGQQVQLAQRRDLINGRYSSQVGSFLQNALGSLKQEQLNLVLLDAQLKVRVFEPVFRGTLTQITVSPREIFQRALQVNAYGLMVAHNHPSGGLQPSQADCQFVKRLQDLGLALDIPLLDAFVVTNNQYFSFSEHQLLV
ncbi:JAB domain-containing protein [Lactobacillaceae bacterium L1_55_11]|nr:JAB domain-containing protein [Lactobacillaceae bacterium L1_55_11]